jgi:hypothetical protein
VKTNPSGYAGHDSDAFGENRTPVISDRAYSRDFSLGAVFSFSKIILSKSCKMRKTSCSAVSFVVTFYALIGWKKILSTFFILRLDFS